MKINPYEIIDIRRKIKKYEETGIQETMKLVKKLREWKLQVDILALTECPRTLLYVANRLKSVQEGDPKWSLMRMCKYLYKEWKQQFQKHLKHNKESEKPAN